MKKLSVFLIVCLVSVYSFAKCDFFQVANDCNGQSTTIIAKNDNVTLNIHANWNQGNISYKFQSGPEKLDMLVYTNNATSLYTEISYKNKSAKMYYDFSLEQMTIEDASSFLSLIQSVTLSFLNNINILLAELPTSTENLQSISDLANALLNKQPPAHSNASIWRWIAYNACVVAQTVSCVDSGDFTACFDRGEKSCRKIWLEDEK